MKVTTNCTTVNPELMEAWAKRSAYLRKRRKIKDIVLIILLVLFVVAGVTYPLWKDFIL